MKGLERKLEHYSHHQQRQFECFWGDGYRGDDNKSILAYHDFDFFNEDRGYEREDIDYIDAMEIDEVINLNCVTGQHWVRRIK
jgi:hypothetical protein